MLIIACSAAGGRFVLTIPSDSCILDLQDGRIVCPVCRRRTDQVVLSETSADQLVVFCKWCKHELVVKIEDGLCQCLRQRLSARARA